MEEKDDNKEDDGEELMPDVVSSVYQRGMITRKDLNKICGSIHIDETTNLLQKMSQ